MTKKNTKETSKDVAKIASKLLRDPKSSKDVRIVAGSDLSQIKSTA